MLTLVEHLKQAGDLDRSAARPRSSCSRAPCPAVGNVRQYARIVRENAMLRRLLHASYEIQAQVHGHEALPRELVDMAERADPRGRPRGLAQGLPLDRAACWTSSSTSSRSSRLEGTPITGTPSGFEDLDTHHRRLPARQPDHPRRPPVDGQVGA